MMVTVRRVVCVLAAALCCTALCVAAAAPGTSAAPSTGGATGAPDLSMKQTVVTAKTETFEAARKAEEAAIAFKDALSKAVKVQEATRTTAEDEMGILEKGAKRAVGLGYVASQKTLAALTLLESLRVPDDEVQNKAKEAVSEATKAVTNATKAVTDAESLLKEVKTEEQKVKEAMEKAKQGAGSIPTGAEHVLAAVGKAEQEANKASAAVDNYIKKLNDANQAVKDVLTGTKAIYSAATKVDECAKKVKSGTVTAKGECNEHKQVTLDGFEALLRGLKRTNEAIVPSKTKYEELAGLLPTAMKYMESAVRLAKDAKSTAEVALQQARKQLEADEQKQNEMKEKQRRESEKQRDTNEDHEKQKEEILESEVSERDEQKGLNRPQQQGTIDVPATTPPVPVLLPKSDGTADGEKLLAQHTDG
ncbi:hypothetical protein DQ04_18371000, partial [Trypanosoma grayi]|uniref:hypothetical protein n=1 Tax=Trypanosoma grayi TaxID=71804 RepID=UPI0004F42318